MLCRPANSPPRRPARRRVGPPFSRRRPITTSSRTCRRARSAGSRRGGVPRPDDSPRAPSGRRGRARSEEYGAAHAAKDARTAGTLGDSARLGEAPGYTRGPEGIRPRGPGCPRLSSTRRTRRTARDRCIISAPPESRLVMRWTTLVIATPDYASRPTRTSTAGGQRT